MDGAHCDAQDKLVTGAEHEQPDSQTGCFHAHRIKMKIIHLSLKTKGTKASSRSAPNRSNHILHGRSRFYRYPAIGETFFSPGTQTDQEGVEIQLVVTKLQQSSSFPRGKQDSMRIER